VGNGPGDLNTLRLLMSLAAQLLNKNIAVLDGRPSYVTVGGQEYATYDLNLSVQGQTA
jgi:hypothetical protein